ncbi:hypothetical protein AB0M29_24690 [Streptomyces sp. NPDC051976]|uniref:hypothetical protein n=1 Tax=Streptomyces sp. NPDC051976 TaxID=3154947 RepID=UPI003445D907
MSTPPDQPSASPYQNPPPAGGYGAPVPAQHNPYAQPAQPSAYGAQPAPYGAQPGPYGQVAPSGAGRGGGAGKAVLWAVVGAVVASGLWGGGVLLLHKDAGKADLRGYTSKSDLCAASDLSAFTSQYPKPDDSPTKYGTKGDALTQSYCSESLKKDGSTYSDAYLSLELDLHKKTDPSAEFADLWQSYKYRGSDSKYQVKPVTGFGDEAYLVTQDTVTSLSDGTQSGDREVTLAVRDGWATFSMSWSAYASSLNSSSTTTVASLSDATTWVETATRATLPKLRK